MRKLWLVDLGAGEVSVYRRADEQGYAEVAAKRRGDALSPEALPDVTVTVDDVLG